VGAAASAASAAIQAGQDQFIALWAEMGSAWGIPRTMAECHALLYIVGEPMNTDAVMERLRISRGNASMTLRTLVEWGLVSRIHLRGDRREYFRAEQDVWRLFTIILRERKRREFDPLARSLAACRELTEPMRLAEGGGLLDPDAARLEGHHRRLDAMLELIQTLDRLTERFMSSGSLGVQMATALLSKAH